MRKKIYPKNSKIEPKIGIVETEKTSTNALKCYFINVEIKERRFCYCQTIMKRASKICLYSLYQKEEYFELLNTLSALALIPENQEEK